jgi:membrane protein implicated in regulation of membrane protease activity
VTDPGILARLDWGAAAFEAGLIVAAVLGLAILAALTQRSRKTRFQLGEDFTADAATVEIWDGRSGYVRVGGELWKAEAKAPLARGDAVKVARKDGMLLRVTPV